MKIDLKYIKVSELFEKYQNNDEAGVVGYGGLLNIRPPYQREFVYKDKQRDEVIHTLRNGFPLNMMYWAKTASGFELMDGQQRTLSICQYVSGVFSVDINAKSGGKATPKSFFNLTVEQQQQIKNYELSVYVCEGTEEEKLDWFKIINIAGEKLTDQELRNAVYTGTWLTDAKRHFSKSTCPAYSHYGSYLNGSAIRQDYLETVLSWISNDNIEKYMSEHQHDNDAQALWQYFEEVMAWVKRIFPNFRSKMMKGLDWGILFNAYGKNQYNAKVLEEKIIALIDDDEVSNKRGIYEYLLSGNEKTLNLRAFDDKTKLKVYERQKGICPITKQHFDIKDMEADHIIPWHSGGKTTIENCQMVNKLANRSKGGR